MSCKISFYELTATPLEKVLPRFLEKLYAQHLPAVIRASTEERVEMLSHLLWTYKPGSFLPHGTDVDGAREEQFFWLTTGVDKPQKAQILILIDGSQESHFDPYTRSFYFFDGHIEKEKVHAHTYWRMLQGHSLSLNFWKQTSNGQWEAQDVFPG